MLMLPFMISLGKLSVGRNASVGVAVVATVAREAWNKWGEKSGSRLHRDKQRVAWLHGERRGVNAN